MPLDIATEDSPAPIGVDALVDWLHEARIDPRDEAALAAAGPMLARLGADRGFLADAAAAMLKDRCREASRGNRYGAQVMLLHRGRGGLFLRANIWPAADDPIVRTSGVAPFFYGVAHGHNFPFVTHGYLGPGYWSDYFEHDYDAAAGVPGEAAALTPAGRSRLWRGRTMLYRAHRDVHLQHPADALSVSLNIVAAGPHVPWLDQYRFDTARGVVDGLLGTSPTETLIGLLPFLDDGDGIDLVEQLAIRHPSGRLRATAWLALADAAPDGDAAARLLERGAGDGDAFTVARCRAALDSLRPEGTSLPTSAAA